MKRLAIVILICAAAVLAFGCTAILEGERLLVTPRPPAYDRPPVHGGEQIEAADFDELKAAILGFVAQHEQSGRIVIFGYSGDVESDIGRAIYEIINHDPLGAFAVYAITETVTPIVSHFEVDISIEYSRSFSEVDSIVEISTAEHLRSELLYYMSQYRTEAVIRTSLPQVTEEYVISLAMEIYFDNPRSIVMMPVVAAQAFPAQHGDDKIIELDFAHMEPETPGTLSERGERLVGSVRLLAELADGETYEDVLLSLADLLIGSTTFDEGTARTISAPGTQNFAATAYRALTGESAVGEGFAMAFKALCDELGFESRVVLGQLDGMFHAWNVVVLDGEHFHIDVAMGAVHGIETVFLMTDAEFIEMGYTWNI